MKLLLVVALALAMTSCNPSHVPPGHVPPAPVTGPAPQAPPL